MNRLAPLKRRLGVIDLGSNSARLVVAAYTPGQAFKITDEVSRRVRLVEGLAVNHRLQPGGMRRALEALQLFATFCRANAIAHVIPVATAAVRDADNRAEFLAKVQATTGLRLRVLSGEREAYLGALSAINSLNIAAGLVMDIGGGSAEISRIQGRRFKHGVTTSLGAVRLTESYLSHDPVQPLEARHLKRHLADTFDTLSWMRLGPGEVFVGLGGTIRALARIDRESRGYPINLIHGYELELSRLERLLTKLRGLRVKERARQTRGLRADRVDSIVAGGWVVATAMRRAGAQRLIVCGQGLREGILYQEFLKSARSPIIRCPREFSVLNLARLYGYEIPHTRQVAKLALSLFDQLHAAHGYSAVERGYLWAAAQLHDIGTVVDYYDHHKHSAYLILSTGLPGYSHREIALISRLCLYHRKGNPALDPFTHVCERGDLDRLRCLAALLRLAECLDHSQSQAVRKLSVRVSSHTIYLTIHVRTRAEGRMEIWEAQRGADLFEAAFGRKLEIEAA